MTRRQPLATFRPPALNDKAATFSAHTLTKTVSLGTTTIIGLKSSLHSKPPKTKYRYLKTGRLTIVYSSVKDALEQ